jgi:hypothetical protein
MQIIPFPVFVIREVESHDGERGGEQGGEGEGEQGGEGEGSH